MHSQRRWLLVFLPLLVLACGGERSTVQTTGQSIIGGAPDTAHPYVGTIVFEQDGVTKNICSGVLISPTVYLSVGSCIDRASGFANFGVSFDPVFSTSSAYVTGVAQLHPLFPAVDIGVIVLDEAQTSLGFAEMPAEHQLDDGRREGALVGQKFTIVGYGADEAGPKVPRLSGAGIRRAATVEFDSVVWGSLLVTREDPVGDNGAICYGDAGAPYLFDGTDVLAAVVWGGTRYCNGMSYGLRVDVPAVFDFLSGVLEQ